MKNEIVKSNVPRLTVCLRNCMDVKVGACSPLHFHDELELLQIYRGSLHCVVGDVDYTASEGDIVFVNTRVPHHTYFPEVCDYGLVQFRETDFIDGEALKIIKYSARFRNIDDEPVKIFRNDELFNLLKTAIDEAEKQNVAFDFYIRSSIFGILGCLYRSGILTNAEAMYASKEVQKIHSALSYINTHYSEGITLDEISAHEGLDPSYFCRVFKGATGATFTEYLNFVRVCKAETMLARTSLGILEISEAVGFSSVSYFGRIFKRYRGCSPRTYRSAMYVKISRGERV